MDPCRFHEPGRNGKRAQCNLGAKNHAIVPLVKPTDEVFLGNRLEEIERIPDVLEPENHV